MFYEVIMSHDVTVHPKYFGPNILRTVMRRLHDEIEGTCSSKYGYIIAVNAIKDVDKLEGQLKPGRAFATFHVKFSAIVMKPFKNEVIEANVTEVNKVGIFCEAGPLRVFVSKHCIAQDMQFDPYYRTPCYKTADEDVVIQEGDVIRVKIINTRVDGNEMMALGTLMDKYLGLILTSE